MAVLPSVVESEAIAGRTHRLSGKKLSLLHRGQRASSKTVSQSRHSRAFCKGMDIAKKIISLCLPVSRSGFMLAWSAEEAGAIVLTVSAVSIKRGSPD